jgi:hypothetical protein
MHFRDRLGNRILSTQTIATGFLERPESLLRHFGWYTKRINVQVRRRHTYRHPPLVLLVLSVGVVVVAVMVVTPQAKS